jgi:hypothetical protein
MNTASIGKHFGSLLAAALTAATLSSAATAAESCACLCVEGAPYYVCNSFSGSTKQPTDACTAQLADACPVPDTEVPTGPAGSPEQVPETPEPVNAAARANGLECQPRQVYRPDLAEHKVYTVCMPEALVAAKAQRVEKPGKSRSPH